MFCYRNFNVVKLKRAKISPRGVFLEKLERDPSRYLPNISSKNLSSPEIQIDLNLPIDEICKILTKYPIKTKVILSGPMIVARDIAHGKIKEYLDKNGKLPEYFIKYPIYYAGPAKTPNGMTTGSFGPTTAGRMDSYVDLFQKQGGSRIMLAKGNRSKMVKDSCKKYNGFYLGSIGGPGAILAQNNIKKVECVEFPELGMEAIWKIEIKDFPAFIVIDNKGNDFFEEFEIYLDLLNQKNGTSVIVGDFNIHVERSEDVHAKRLHSLLRNYSFLSNLTYCCPYAHL